jgi:hypothetical protein
LHFYVGRRNTLIWWLMHLWNGLVLDWRNLENIDGTRGFSLRRKVETLDGKKKLWRKQRKGRQLGIGNSIPWEVW